MLEPYRQENDHVSRFLSESHTVADGDVLEDDIYKDYEAWCDGEGTKALSKTKFREGVIKWGAVRRRKGSKERYFVFEGLGLHSRQTTTRKRLGLCLS